MSPCAGCLELAVVPVDIGEKAHLQAGAFAWLHSIVASISSGSQSHRPNWRLAACRFICEGSGLCQ